MDKHGELFSKLTAVAMVSDFENPLAEIRGFKEKAKTNFCSDESRLAQTLELMDLTEKTIERIQSGEDILPELGGDKDALFEVCERAPHLLPHALFVLLAS